jgi:nucleotide-binding universal stress UspA family protein
MRVVVGTDGSPHADRAVLWVARWGHTFGGLDVTLINVGHVPHAPAVGPGVHRLADFRIIAERLEHEGQDILTHAARAFAEHATHVTTEYRTGDPSEEILKLAREIHADLIVLGRRGLGRIGGLVLGSVSERVLHGAHCAVVIAR